MEIEKSKILNYAIENILRGLCRVLLRYSISANEFMAMFKKIYVETAREELGIRGRPANKSRIAAATGLSRKEVTRLCDELDKPNEAVESVNLQHNRSIRLIHNWISNPKYHDSEGNPIALPLTDADLSFENLVKEQGGDIPFKAMLKELLRSGVVAEADGLVSLNTHGFIPAESEIDKLNLLGLDVGLLLGTIDHNIQSNVNKQDPMYQRKVAYRRINEKGIQLIQQLAHEDGQKLLEKLDKLLPDYTVPTDSKEKSFYAGLSTFTFKVKN